MSVSVTFFDLQSIEEQLTVIWRKVVGSGVAEKGADVAKWVAKHGAVTSIPGGPPSIHHPLLNPTANPLRVASGAVHGTLVCTDADL